MSNLSLYNITNKFAKIMEQAENGELTENEYNAIGLELAKELQNKSSNIIAYIKNSEYLLENIKAEKKRLDDMEKLGNKKLEKFKQYVIDNMEKLNINEIQTELGKMSIAKNPISVEVEDEEKIPNEFTQIVSTIKVDKNSIKNHFKETGEVVNGVKIIDDKVSLRIK